MKVKCIKSLYKRTYKKNAFTKGKIYLLDEQLSTIYFPDEIYLIDVEKHSFNFSIAKNDVTFAMYEFSDYFKFQSNFSMDDYLKHMKNSSIIG